MFNKQSFVLCLIFYMLFILGTVEFTNAQNRVIIIVMDGARWTETFGGGAAYIPHLYNDMRPYGTLYTDFRIDYNAGAMTVTNPGHATIETGSWQTIANDGTERPTLPIVFEYYRKQTGAGANTCYAVTGKSKLNILTYSTYAGYGQTYGGTWVGDDYGKDATTYNKVISAMQDYQPNILVVNFAEVDIAGHSGNMDNYTAAITNADNYIYQIWQHIQSGDWGYNTSNTTLFITNDHGRHTTSFDSHGDGCEGCTHIMLLALGRNVIPRVIDNLTYQRDIAPTVGDLLGFTTPYATGTSLFNYLPPLPVELSSFTGRLLGNHVLLEWKTKIEVNDYGFEVERSVISNGERNLSWQKVGFVNGSGNSNSPKNYSFTDKNLIGGSKFQYRLKQIDNDGQFEYSNIIEATLLPNEYALYQNYPNPFNPITKIKFALPEAGKVSLKIYSMTGEEIAELANSNYEAGFYDIELKESNLASGVYIYRLHSNNFTVVKKLVVLK